MSIDKQSSSFEKEDLNPYIDQLAARLMDVATSADVKFDSMGWELITEVLSYAASAEQRLGEQQDRISYLERLSVTDELTGLTNRRGLRMVLAQILADAARHRETGVIGFIDLNDFKTLNDTKGHAAGDAALRFLGTLLKKKTRSSDVAARISGDEFAVLMPRCSEEQGRKRMQALKETINKSSLYFEGQQIPISCSLGVAPYRAGLDPNTLLSAADSAMYADKLAHKNKPVIF